MTPDEHQAEIAAAVFGFGVRVVVVGVCVGALALVVIAIWELLT